MLKILNILAPATLVGGVTAITVSSILAINVTIEYPYNYLVSDLSKSTDPQDHSVYNFYEQNTASIFLHTKNSVSGSMGTIWNWPSEETNYYYFATNIHVINDALVYTANTSLPMEQRFSLSSMYEFAYHSNQKEREKLSGVELMHIAVSPTDFIADEYNWGSAFYNDLAVLRTTTKIFSTDNSLDFIDTDTEIQALAADPAGYDYYIAGFPASKNINIWPASATWTSAKYQWKFFQGAKYDQKPILTTSASLFGVNDFIKRSELGLNISQSKLLAKSYARQLILPGLNLAGGSSGSLVSVWQDNQLKPLGIYWGVYEIDNNLFYAGVDLFYSGSYQLYSGNNAPVLNYSHLPNSPWTQYQTN